MRIRKRKEKKGFTLVELICVVALLAILAVLAVPAYNKVQDGARQQIANSNARTAYSIGKANEALKSAGIESLEETIAGSSIKESDGVVISGHWEGTLSGSDKTYTGNYPLDATK